jgi:small subunit ribosomal protein S4
MNELIFLPSKKFFIGGHTMSRYTGPSWKIARRLGYSISETGKELQKRPYAPGMHGQKRTKLSEYGLQQQEKQRVRFTYGVSEKQFYNTFEKASKMDGMTGVNFLTILECRLDNLVFRTGFATSRRQARQLVNHGHILVDGKKVDIPSYIVKPGQTISLKEASKSLVIVKNALETKFARAEYISYDENNMVASLVRLPERNEFLPEINEQLIVEFYNR